MKKILCFKYMGRVTIQSISIRLILTLFTILLFMTTSIPVQATLISYSNESTFYTQNPGIVVEDFEEGDIQQEFHSPLDSTNSNAAFSPGDILPGVAFSNNDDNWLALSDSTVYTGLKSKTLIKTAESAPGGHSSLDIFFSGDNVYSVGLDIYHTLGGTSGLMAADTTVSIFGLSDVLLGSYSMTTLSDGPLFFGAFSDSDIITHVNVDGVVSGYYSFEMIDNVAFNPVPEPTTMLLFGSGLIGLAGFWRKRFKK